MSTSSNSSSSSSMRAYVLLVIIGLLLLLLVPIISGHWDFTPAPVLPLYHGEEGRSGSKGLKTVVRREDKVLSGHVVGDEKTDKTRPAVDALLTDSSTPLEEVAKEQDVGHREDAVPETVIKSKSARTAAVVAHKDDATTADVDGLVVGDTLQYSDPLDPPPEIEDHSKECPKRYVWVNTHTFGRHHNQLQEMLNLALWSEYLGRTAVIGFFRHDHKWTDPADFYDFSRIRKHYCLITHKEFLKQNEGTTLSGDCWGQGVKSTPMKNKVKCKMSSEVGSHYNVRNGMNITKGYLLKFRKSEAPMLVLSGQLAFFMRAGLRNAARLYALLEPAEEIKQEIYSFLKNKKVAGNLWDGEKKQPAPYFGLHLRQREKECMKEVRDSMEDGAHLLQAVPARHWEVIKTQCAMTVPHVHTLSKSLGFVPDKSSPEGAMFLASDHQNKVLEKNLVDAGATMYSGGKFHTREMGGLKGLAVDFFLLTMGKFFTGNQLSSISQNVCLIRLGRGLGCNGFVKGFHLYHSRNVTEAGLPKLVEKFL